MISISSNVLTFSFLGERQTLYRCASCGEWFEPGLPWDMECIPCYARQQAATVNALAERERA